MLLFLFDILQFECKNLCGFHFAELRIPLSDINTTHAFEFLWCKFIFPVQCKFDCDLGGLKCQEVRQTRETLNAYIRTPNELMWVSAERSSDQINKSFIPSRSIQCENLHGKVARDQCLSSQFTRKIFHTM